MTHPEGPTPPGDLPPAREPLRIAYIASSLRPGGSERQMLALAARLPRDRFQVDFITLSDEGIYADAARQLGARVFSLGETAPAGTSGIKRIGRRITKTLRLLALIRRGRYAIVDAWMHPTYELVALTRPLTGVPIVVTGRRNIREPGTGLARAQQVVERLARRMSDAIVANSEAVATNTRSLEGTGPPAVSVIRNGVEPLPPMSDGERLGLRRSWGLEADDLVIGCVANYRDVKRHAVLIAGFAAISARFPQARLVLVGDGPLRHSLERDVRERGLENRVRLHGSEPDARAIYGAFDIVALTSRNEGLPNALLEASAAGLPIVATAVGGIPEIVLDGLTGLLLPVDDAPAVAVALARLCEDPDLRARLGAAARDRVGQEYGMDRFVRSFERLYESLAEARGLPATRQPDNRPR